MPAPEVEPARRLLLDAVERVVRASAGLDVADVNWRPTADASSLAALALHVLGATEQNVMTSLTGTRPTARNRDDEFAAREETVHQVASNETASTRYQDFIHRFSAPTRFHSSTVPIRSRRDLNRLQPAIGESLMPDGIDA